MSGQGQSGQNSQRLIPGQPIGTFWGPEFVGVSAAGKQQFNKYTVVRDASGNETSRTLNGTTTAPGSDDNVILGNANPKFSAGVRSAGTWGNFEFSTMIRSDVGQKVFNNTALVYGTKSNVLQNLNFLRSALDDGVAIGEPAIFSSRYVESGSFLRVANVTVGYNFTLKGLSSKGQKMRVYLSGDNLLMFTGYKGYDPEVHAAAGLAVRGIDYLAYPRARAFTTGVRIGF